MTHWVPRAPGGWNRPIGRVSPPYAKLSIRRPLPLARTAPPVGEQTLPRLLANFRPYFLAAARSRRTVAMRCAAERSSRLALEVPAANCA